MDDASNNTEISQTLPLYIKHRLPPKVYNGKGTICPRSHVHKKCESQYEGFVILDKTSWNMVYILPGFSFFTSATTFPTFFPDFSFSHPCFPYSSLFWYLRFFHLVKCGPLVVRYLPLMTCKYFVESVFRDISWGDIDIVCKLVPLSHSHLLYK